MEDRLFSVADQVTFVSGASRGIGYALAKGFAERGAQVIITGRKRATIDKAAAEISDSTGTRVRAMTCDVADIRQIQRVVSKVIEEFGRIDTLLNVAGVNVRKPVERYTPEEYDFILNINLRGAFFLAKEVGKHMIERRNGSQINIDSFNSHAPLKGVIPYAMSKHGIKGMTRGLAMEWGKYGVRVNGIGPGFILTDLISKLLAEPQMNEWGLANTPLGRFGKVEDLIGTAVFLASEAAAFLTGQTIYVDGGITAGVLWPIELE